MARKSIQTRVEQLAQVTPKLDKLEMADIINQAIPNMENLTLVVMVSSDSDYWSDVVDHLNCKPFCFLDVSRDAKRDIVNTVRRCCTLPRMRFALLFCVDTIERLQLCSHKLNGPVYGQFDFVIDTFGNIRLFKHLSVYFDNRQ